MNLKQQKTRELLERLQITAEEVGETRLRIASLERKMNDLKYEIQQRTKEDVTDA